MKLGIEIRMTDRTRPLIILGCSGHGRVVLDSIRAGGADDILGWIDDASGMQGREIEGCRVLGPVDHLPALRAAHGRLRGIVAVGDNFRREQCMTRVRELVPDFEFTTAVHPAAVVASGVGLGPGSVVMAGAVLNPGCRIGQGCIVNTRASLDHDVIMEDYSSVAPGVVVGGEASIGTGSAIGIGAVIANRIRIGRNTVVGAGAVVVRHLPDNVVAFGNPARVIRQRRDDEPYLTAHIKKRQ